MTAGAAANTPSLGNAQLDQYVGTVKHLSSSGKHTELAEFVAKNLEMLGRVIGVNVKLMNSTLDSMDVGENTLGHLGVLSAVIHQNIDPWDELYTRISVFITGCNGQQVQFAPAGFADLCHVFSDKLMERKKPITGISLMIRAVEKLRSSSNTLTSVHSDVAKLCLAARCLTPALPLLKADYVDISWVDNTDPKHILLFFYYGGMILTAMKDFNRALFYFEVCVTVPATCVSHIALEAYKKYILVFLISQGDQPKEAINLPKYTSAVVTKFIIPLCKPYQDVVTAFYSNKTEALQKAIDKNAETFTTDQTEGLIEQVKRSQIENNIKRLTKTFRTLSISDLANRVSLGSVKEAEAILVDMIKEKKIFAKITHQNGMVRFSSNPDGFNSVAQLNEIESMLASCIDLDKKIGVLDEEILLNSHYIKKSGASSASSGAGGGGGERVSAAAGGSSYNIANGGPDIAMAASSSSSSAAAGSSSAANGGGPPKRSASGIPMNID